MTKKYSRPVLFTAGLLLSLICLEQRVASASTDQAYNMRKEEAYLPDDLPQAKLLFVKYSAIDVPAKRPDNLSRQQYKLIINHNEVFPTTNAQLVKAAAKYPFPYRITTQDSVTYYAEHGYKYALFHSSFDAVKTGHYVGSSSNGYYTNTTTVKLFIQDLTTGKHYPVDTFSETFIYYYKGIVKLLMKRVDKQFAVNK